MLFRARSLVTTLIAAATAAACSGSQTPEVAKPIDVVAIPLTNASAQQMAYQQVEDITPPFGLTATDGSGLVLSRVDAKAVFEGPLAFTELHLYFHNPENRRREGTFQITLPSGAAVSRFAMETDGQMVEAEVVDKMVARRAYDDFLHRRQDPALLEKGAGNEFTAKVFPIAPNADKHIVISFSQQLAGAPYVLPLRGLPQTDRVDVALQVLNTDGTRGEESLHQQAWKPDRDFVSTLAASAAAVGANGMIAAQVGVDGVAQASAPTPPKAVTLFVDTSASRAAGFVRYVKTVHEMVSNMLQKYGEALPIEVVAFDQDSQVIYSGPVKGYGEAQDKALIERGAAGASDLEQAFASLAPLKDGPVRRVVVVTDGVMTAGATGADLAAAAAKIQYVDRIDVVLAGGIRDEAAATALVRAKVPHAGAVLDLDAEGPAAIAFALAEPVLLDVTVDVPGATWVYPRVLPTVRAGHRAMVYARVPGATQGVNVVVGGVSHQMGVAGVAPALVGRAVASAEIELELESKLDGAHGDEAKQLKDAISKKSVAARVVSSQTAMLVLESDADYARYHIDRTALADILVVGANGVEQTQRKAAPIAIATNDPPAHKKPVTTKGDEKKQKDGPSVNKENLELQLAKHDGDDAKPDPSEATRDVQDADKSERARTSNEELDRAPGGTTEGGMAGDASSDAQGHAQVTTGMSMGSASNGADAGAPSTPAAEPVASPPPPPMHVAQTQNQPSPPRRAAPDQQIANTTAGDGDGNDDQAGNAPDGGVWPPADKPIALTGPLGDIEAALARKDADGALKLARAWHDKEPGDVLALIGLGDALEAKHATETAARVYGSIIDLFPARADLRRFAGERLERLGAAPRWLAVDTYKHAVEDRPDHLTGHRLLAYALLRDGKPAEAFAAILAGIDQQYPAGRYLGADRVLAEDAGMIGAAYLKAKPDAKKEVDAELTKRGLKLATGASTRFILYWETDGNDVDFHIQDAKKNHAFYGHKHLASGGDLYADITTGYGPECFAIQGAPSAGPYQLSIDYFSQGPMGYGMGLLEVERYDGKGGLTFEDRPYVIMADHAFVDLGSFK